MISYADFEFAISRWKARAAGVAQPEPPSPAASGMVESEVPVPSAPEPQSAEYAGQVTNASRGSASGSIVVNDDLLRTPMPE